MSLDPLLQGFVHPGLPVGSRGTEVSQNLFAVAYGNKDLGRGPLGAAAPQASFLECLLDVGMVFRPGPQMLELVLGES